jgi:hypothetical protein
LLLNGTTPLKVLDSILRCFPLGVDLRLPFTDLLIKGRLILLIAHFLILHFLLDILDLLILDKVHGESSLLNALPLSLLEFQVHGLLLPQSCSHRFLGH